MAVITITKDNFENEVLGAKLPVVLDFWAEWCGPCQMVLPIVEKLGEELTDVKICKVNVDEQMDLAREYRVMSIPTFLLFKEGEVVKKELGARTKEELLSMLGK